MVLLFMDELSTCKLLWDWYHEVWDEGEDKEMFSILLYSSTSGIWKAWPTEHDPDLVTLCKAINNRDGRVTRVILSSSRISDEGFKNLSTALTQSELYSLTLFDNGLQSQGLEYLCEAPISSDCNLTSSNVSDNWLGEEGIIHLCNALIGVNCKLTNLTVTGTFFGKTGLKHLCDALTTTNCKYKSVTSLNVSCNRLGEEGIIW